MLKYDVEGCNFTAVLWSLISVETKNVDWGVCEQGAEENNECKTDEDSEMEIKIKWRKLH